MNERSFTTTISVAATPQQVFDAVNDVRAWWGTTIVGPSDSVGDEIVHDVRGIHHCRIRVTSSEPGRRVAWTILENSFTFVDDKDEWVGNELVFDIRPDGDRTTL